MSLKNLVYRTLSFGINDKFDCKTLIPKIKRAINGIAVNFVYSIEKGKTKAESSGLHIHLMLVVDCSSNDINPVTVFYHKIRPSILKLKNVTWCNIPDRKYESRLKNYNAKYHNLKIQEEYIDAKIRYSYLAKKNSKDGVDNFNKKNFAKSQLNPSKYYSFIQGNNMLNSCTLKIKEISKFHKLNIFSEKIINDEYIKFRRFKHTETQDTKFFHFEDLNTNRIVGYYACSYDVSYDYETNSIQDFMFTLDNLYIEELFKDQANWFDFFTLHLFDLIKSIIIEIGLEKSSIINTYSENTVLQDIIDMVMDAVCKHLDLTFLISDPMLND